MKENQGYIILDDKVKLRYVDFDLKNNQCIYMFKYKGQKYYGPFTIEDFKKFPRNLQHKFAEFMYEEKLYRQVFKSPYAPFVRLCEELGFEKEIIDTKQKNKTPDASFSTFTKPLKGEIFISREKSDEILDDIFVHYDKFLKLLPDTVSDRQKSKIIVALLNACIDMACDGYKQGELDFCYPNINEEYFV